MKISKILVLTSLVALSTGLAVFADEMAPPPPPPPVGQAPPTMPARPPVRMVPPAASLAMNAPIQMIIMRGEEIQLTDDQKAKLNDLRKSSDEILKPLQETSRNSIEALRKAVLVDNSDAATVSSLITNAENADTAVVKAQVKVWGLLRAILTADQMKNATDMLINPRPFNVRPNTTPPGAPAAQPTAPAK